MAGMLTAQTFVILLDLAGTFVFAISGAVAAVNRRRSPESCRDSS